MSTLESKFVVVICHGSFHTPELYRPLVNALKSRQVEAVCPHLPTADLTKLDVGDPLNPDFDRDPPVGGHLQPADDVAVVKDILSQLIVSEKRKVLLLGHSSGGFTATASAVPELQSRALRAKGLEGGVMGIFYECALMIPLGESITSFTQPKDGSAPVIPPFCNVHKHGFDGLLSSKDTGSYFFNDLAPEVALKYEALMTATPIARTVLTNDAYTSLPCAYLLTENDRALPIALQEGMVNLQSARQGVNITMYRCSAGHDPQLSWTEGLADAITEFGLRALDSD